MIPPTPASAAALAADDDRPLGWTYSPSTFTQRIPIVALAFVGLFGSRSMTNMPDEAIGGDRIVSSTDNTDHAGSTTPANAVPMVTRAERTSDKINPPSWTTTVRKKTRQKVRAIRWSTN
jgi:hypothetical protein